jgi:iron complex transport system substrate-binding protein
MKLALKIGGLGLLAFVLMQGTAKADVRRVVSLNPCLDVILVHVADRAQIAALSHYSRDADTSTIPELARGFPMTYESAEEVMALAPDLVLTSVHSSVATLNILRRLDIKTELFDTPLSIADSTAQVRRVAGLVGHPARGEDLVARIEDAITAAEPSVGAAPVPTVIFQRNGFSPGTDTLMDEMLRRTGFTNVAARYGAEWGNIPLEELIVDPPRVLLAGEMLPNMPTWADRVVRHPALRRLESRMTRAAFPDRLLYCGGPVLIEAAEVLAKARAAAPAAPR